MASRASISGGSTPITTSTSTFIPTPTSSPSARSSVAKLDITKYWYIPTKDTDKTDSTTASTTNTTLGLTADEKGGEYVPRLDLAPEFPESGPHGHQLGVMPWQFTEFPGIMKDAAALIESGKTLYWIPTFLFGTHFRLTTEGSTPQSPDNLEHWNSSVNVPYLFIRVTQDNNPAQWWRLEPSGDDINSSTIRNAYAFSMSTTGVPVYWPLSKFGTGENETYDVALQCVVCTLY